MKLLVFLLPFIGALTGWFIVAAMLKLLFWPGQPVKLAFGPIVQGLIPKKREQLAAGIGEIMQSQIQSAVAGKSDVAPDILDRLTETAAEAVRERVYDRIPSVDPKAIRLKIASLVEDIVKKEIPGFVTVLADNMESESGRNLSQWIAQALREYDLGEAEGKMLRSPETFYLKAGAAAVGILSGTVQLLVVYLAYA